MNAEVFTAKEVYEMMTIGGAIAAGWGEEAGALERGRLADITVLQYPSLHLIDEQRLLSNVIFSATGADVHAVFVGGRPLVWGGKILHIDEEELVGKTLESMARADVHPTDYPSKRMGLRPAVTPRDWEFVSRHWLTRGRT